MKPCKEEAQINQFNEERITIPANKQHLEKALAQIYSTEEGITTCGNNCMRKSYQWWP